MNHRARSGNTWLKKRNGVLSLKYEVRIVHQAEKEIDRLPADIHERISNKILSLEDNPRPHGIKRLSGRNENRLRVGDYRILFLVDDKTHVVKIVAVGNRRDIYR
jgi:mRNA interferase RelE/StbE